MDENNHSSSEPIQVIQREGVEYTLLGTAHVSRKSAETVERMITEGDYDSVAIELCQNRYQALTRADQWQQMDLFRILREGKAGMVMASLALSGYQRRIAEQFGIEPGAEMKAAIECAGRQDTELQLIDRDLQITLKRVYRSIPWWRRMLMLSGLAASSFSSEEISEEEIEKLKQGDLLESTFNEFAQQTPQIYASLIDERDRYMAARLRQQNQGRSGDRVLAVVGAGHLPGLSRYLDEAQAEPIQEQKTLNQVPPGGRWLKILPWAIVALVIIGFSLGFYMNRDIGMDLVKKWILFNGTLAALGAALARGHPLTIVTAFLAAPLTSLNPTIAAGMVSGLMEAWIRKPTMEHLENLRSDVSSLKGWYRNPATRVLLVFFLSNLGSMIGTWIAGAAIVAVIFEFFQSVWGQLSGFFATLFGA